MQNSGLGNSINAIKSLLELYDIPIIFLMSHRGGKGEEISAQIPMGETTPQLLDCIRIKRFIIETPNEIPTLTKAIEYYKQYKKSVAVLLPIALWRGT